MALHVGESDRNAGIGPSSGIHHNHALTPYNQCIVQTVWKPATLCAVLLVSACSTFVHRVPEPSIYIRQISPRLHQSMFFEGPVPIECEVWISNVAKQPLELKAVELHSDARGSFTFTSRTLPVDAVIPAGGTINFTVLLWGYSRGGDFVQDRPVPLAGKAWFALGHTRPQAVPFRIVL